MAPGVVVRVETFRPGEENGVSRNVVKLRDRFSNGRISWRRVGMLRRVRNEVLY